MLDRSWLLQSDSTRTFRYFHSLASDLQLIPNAEAISASVIPVISPSSSVLLACMFEIELDSCAWLGFEATSCWKIP